MATNQDNLSYENEKHDAVMTEKADFKADAIEAENAEHNMTVWQAVKAYPMASLWAFVFACLIIMESYDVFLMGNFVALPYFKNTYGVGPADGEKNIVTSWQGALQVSGQLGALIGVFIAGPLTSRVGYRYATLIGLMLLNAFIFIFFFADSLPVFFVAQLLEGIPWGIFIANAPAYCSEIVPIQLRAACTQMIQMFWAIGSIIVGAVTYRYNGVYDRTAFSVPVAIQWIFPTPLAILVFFAPESPWWLVRKGKLEQAKKSVQRLGRKGAANADDTVAMIRRTIELEKSDKKPGYLELFKGTDLRRTLIVSFVYAAQNLTGNLIANQAVYFFEQAGVSSNTAFALGLITSGLQWLGVMFSWVLTAKYGRRSLYLVFSVINIVFLFALGIAGSISHATSDHGVFERANLAQASFGLLVSVFFAMGTGPLAYIYIGETSAIRLRPLTTGFGRGIYYIVELPCIFLASWMLNPTTGADLAGRCGYVWGSTAIVCIIIAYFVLPEMKDRSYREIDILFKRKVDPRHWTKTVVDVNDDE